MKYAPYLISAVGAALEAGKAILKVYQSDFVVEAKEDRSPLTIADKRSHEIIQAGLAAHGIPFVSEEGKSIPYTIRKDWDAVWIVDPLDGTKEFVKRNGEFTVNIALIEKKQPVLGVIYAPVNQWLYFASTEIGAFKMNHAGSEKFALLENLDPEAQLASLMQNSVKLPVEQHRRSYTIVGSRSHGSPDLEAFVEAKKQEKGDVEFIAAGSSLKICMVAEGSADIYPRLGPTMEWDTAAGQAVVQCAGSRMSVFGDIKALEYNKEDLINPWFVVER